MSASSPRLTNSFCNERGARLVPVPEAKHAALLACRDEVIRLKSDLDAAGARAQAAERAALDANEVLRSLRSDQFACETIVPVGDVGGSGNVWVRLRSIEEGVGMLLKQLCRLDERAVLTEAALASANERCRDFEKRAERADWTASELRSAEFEWADTIPVYEPGGDRVLVCVRGTEGGISKLKATMEQLVFFNGLLNRSLTLASDRALEAEAKVAALEAEQAEALASVGGFEVLPADTTTYTVSHGGATMTVTGSPSGVANVVKLAYGGFEYGVSA